jgi:hypothetical protein
MKKAIKVEKKENTHTQEKQNPTRLKPWTGGKGILNCTYR